MSPVVNPFDTPAMRWHVAYTYACGRFDQWLKTGHGVFADSQDFADTAVTTEVGLAKFAALYDLMATQTETPKAA